MMAPEMMKMSPKEDDSVSRSLVLAEGELTDDDGSHDEPLDSLDALGLSHFGRTFQSMLRQSQENAAMVRLNDKQ